MLSFEWSCLSCLWSPWTTLVCQETLYITVDSLHYWSVQESNAEGLFSCQTVTEWLELCQLYAALDSVPSLLLTKKSRTFQDTMKNLPSPVRSLQIFNYKEKMAFTYNIQCVVHCRKFSMKQNVDISCSDSDELWSLYFPFEPLEKNAWLWRIFFQDFPGP